jgi:two-component system response regulator YesN
MIRVLLADDEPLIIKGLRKLIDWEGLGMEIVGQAGDGRALMEMLGRCKPDIVISDINMPHRTGIDIIKEIHESGQPIKVIFISAHQEFTYARDAVTYGAVDYLVKPIIKQQLEKVLLKAASLINEHHEEERRKGKLQLLERKIRQEELHDWLGRLLDGMLAPSSEPYRFLSAELRGPLYAVGIVEVDQLASEPDKWTEKETKLVEFAVGNILQEVAAGPGIGHVFPKQGRYVFVTSHELPEEPILLAEDIKEKIRTFLKLGVTIGVSGTAGDMAELAEAWRQSEQAALLNYFVGLNRVIAYRPLVEPHLPREKELLDCQLRVVGGLTLGNWEEAAAALETLLDTIRTAAYGNRNLAVSTCFSSILFIVQELSKSGIELSEGSLNMHDLQKQLNDYATYDILRTEVVRIAETIFHVIDSGSINKEKSLITKVKQYIEDHYAEEITLESAAGITFMNPSYFSFFFKKHMKRNFKPYVTEVRMKHAVRLLLHTDLMVYEIAEKVGYNNARHFSDIFRKTYCKLPNDYRQEKKRSE